MNIRQLIKLINFIAIFSSILLIYWVFSFILITVFDLKVFQRSLTEMFGLSVLGILAVLAGALALNIMLNLTRIAERNTQDHVHYKHSKWIISGLILIFPLLAGLFFTGDYLTKRKKLHLMQDSAQQVVNEYQSQLKLLANYQFDKEWIDNINRQIKLLEKTNPNIRRVNIIVPDKVNGEAVYLYFNGDEYNYRSHERVDEKSLESNDMISFNIANNNQQQTTYDLYKIDFIFSSDAKKKQMLDDMFNGSQQQPFTSAYHGRYEMFYPYQVDGKTVAVIYLSDYLAYGKMGSY